MRNFYFSILLMIFLAPTQVLATQSVADSNSNTQADQPVSDNAFQSELRRIQNQWAKINYQTVKDKQANAFKVLFAEADTFSSQFPNRAEPLVWQGIILSTWAGAEGGFSALSLVKKARAIFEKSLEIDDKALEASAYTSLGSLYYQVPGWPISFGSDSKAEKYLKKALLISPNGIDSNYFYADYLIQSEGDYRQAKVYLEKALHAAPRPDRSLEDQGRQKQIQEKMTLVMHNLNQI